MGESEFSEFEIKITVGSFIGLVLLFGILTGAGVMDETSGDPPELVQENESLLNLEIVEERFPEFESSTPPSQSGSWSWTEQLDAGVENGGTFQGQDGETYTILYSEPFSGTNTDIAVEVYNGTYEEYEQVDDLETLYLPDNPDTNTTTTILIGGSGASSEGRIIVSGQEITFEQEGSQSAGSLEWKINQPTTGWFDAVAQSVIAILDGLIWFFQVVLWGVFALLLVSFQVLVALIELLLYIGGLMAWLVNGWTSVGGHITGIFGTLFQALTMVLFLIWFNGIMKIIRAVLW